MSSNAIPSPTCTADEFRAAGYRALGETRAALVPLADAGNTALWEAGRLSDFGAGLAGGAQTSVSYVLSNLDHLLGSEDTGTDEIASARAYMEQARALALVVWTTLDAIESGNARAPSCREMAAMADLVHVRPCEE